MSDRFGSTSTSQRSDMADNSLDREETFRGPFLRSPLVAPLSSLAYRWYAKQLKQEVVGKPLPKHIALIADGNRRFAKKLGLSETSDGHRYGAEKVNQVVEWCDELEIPAVTLWVLSTDNLDRSADELERFFDLLREQLASVSSGQSNRPLRRQVRAVGRLDLLPEDVRRGIEEAEHSTAEDGEHRLNIAIAYGGRDEILYAFKQMLRSRADKGESVEDIADKLSPEDIQPYLYAPDLPEPDLIVRTSGEVRLGGFLLWQSVYSELYFSDALWPAFRKIDFLRAIRSYQQRDRRQGR